MRARSSSRQDEVVVELLSAGHAVDMAGTVLMAIVRRDARKYISSYDA
jgi:hypothetical protein